MLSITETQFQQHWSQAINQCLEAHDILQVIRDQGDGFVILSTQDWRAIEETLYLNQFPGLVESIQQAHQEPLEQGIPLEELDW